MPRVGSSREINKPISVAVFGVVPGAQIVSIRSASPDNQPWNYFKRLLSCHALRVGTTRAPLKIAQPFMAGTRCPPSSQVPPGTKGAGARPPHFLPSLAGLFYLFDALPSHKWLGYFHGLSDGDELALGKTTAPAGGLEIEMAGERSWSEIYSGDSIMAPMRPVCRNPPAAALPGGAGRQWAVHRGFFRALPATTGANPPALAAP